MLVFTSGPEPGLEFVFAKKVHFRPCDCQRYYSRIRFKKKGLKNSHRSDCGGGVIGGLLNNVFLFVVMVEAKSLRSGVNLKEETPRH